MIPRDLAELIRDAIRDLEQASQELRSHAGADDLCELLDQTVIRFETDPASEEFM